MEFYLVKDKVRLINLEEVWRPYLENPQHRSKPSPSLKVDLKFPSKVKPVIQSKSAREFAGKLRDVVTMDYGQAYALFQLDVTDENVLEGYVDFDIYAEETDDGGFCSIFGENNANHKISMTLSLCHLPTENTPVSTEAIFTLNKNLNFGWCIYYEADSYGFESHEKQERREVQKLWNRKNGFIYSKLTVMLTLNEDAVTTVMKKEEPVVDFNEIGALTRKMLEEEICTDLEIRCGDGNIVKGHRAVLAGRSKVFQAMLQATEMQEAKTANLEMEEMSEQSVKAFLKWVYWKDDKEAVLESDVAVELLIAGNKYELEGLVGKMKEIILKRGGRDEEWFSVDSAVKLFNWARHLEAMKVFKKKAVRVLKYFGRTAPGKLLESKDYQELIKNDAEVGVQLTQG